MLFAAGDPRVHGEDRVSDYLGSRAPTYPFKFYLHSSTSVVYGGQVVSSLSLGKTGSPAIMAKAIWEMVVAAQGRSPRAGKHHGQLELLDLINGQCRYCNPRCDPVVPWIAVSSWKES